MKKGVFDCVGLGIFSIPDSHNPSFRILWWFLHHEYLHTLDFPVMDSRYFEIPFRPLFFYPFHIRQLNGSNQGVDWAITKLLLMYYNQLPEQHDARATGIYKGHAMPPLWMSPEATLSSITPRSSWTSGKTRQSIESHLLIMKDFFLLKLKWKYKKRIPINALFFFLSSSHQLNLKTKWKMVASLLGKS